MRASVIAALAAAALLGARPSGAQQPKLDVGDVLVTSSLSGRLYPLRLVDPLHPPWTPVSVEVGTPPFSSPRGIAVDRNGLLAVTDTGPRTVSRVDTAAGARDIMLQLSQLTSIP